MWDSNGNIRLEEEDSLPNCNVTRRNVSFSINWLDFLRSFVTTGYRFSRKYWHNPTIPHYIQMYWNQNLRRIFLYRFNMAHSIGKLLTINNNGNLSIDNSYSYLDPSEKVVWSYMLGMVFTKLIAEFQYDVVYLQNLDFVIQHNIVQLNPPLSIRNPRPDFIGQKIDGSWVVFEAKARLNENNCPIDVLREAVTKAKTINRINNYHPILCAGSVLINKQQLKLCTCDPLPQGESEITIENYGKFIFHYYKLLLDFLENEKKEEKEVSQIPFIVSTIEAPEECKNAYMIGIYQPLYEGLKKLKKSTFEKQLNLTDLLRDFNDKLQNKKIDKKKGRGIYRERRNNSN